MVGTKESNNRFVSVDCSLEEFVQHQENKHTLSKTREMILLKTFLVSRNEPRELENIDARDFDVSIANFLLQVRRKTENNNTSSNRWGLSFVTYLLNSTFVSAFSVQYNEDLNIFYCAVRFAIAIKFAFVSTICDLILVICVTLRKLIQWKLLWAVVS